MPRGGFHVEEGGVGRGVGGAVVVGEGGGGDGDVGPTSVDLGGSSREGWADRWLELP